MPIRRRRKQMRERWGRNGRTGERKRNESTCSSGLFGFWEMHNRFLRGAGDGMGGERRRDLAGSTDGARGDGLGGERRRDPVDSASAARGDALGGECRQDPGDSTGGGRGPGAGTAPGSGGFRRWRQVGAGTAFP